MEGIEQEVQKEEGVLYEESKVKEEHPEQRFEVNEAQIPITQEPVTIEPIKEKERPDLTN